MEMTASASSSMLGMRELQTASHKKREETVSSSSSSNWRSTEWKGMGENGNVDQGKEEEEPKKHASY